MSNVLLLGAGKIGRMIAHLLVNSGDFQLRVGDVDPLALQHLRERVDLDTRVIDVSDPQQISAALEGCDVVVSALNFRFNVAVAQAALTAGASYFDLTEDVGTTQAVRELATAAREGQVFVSQCGLAPGFVGIVGRHLVDQFEQVDQVRLRAGVLPQFPDNALKYNLTWSTDGLINEYCNSCAVIHDGKPGESLPLEGLERLSLDGVDYEAFNTSGGIGTLCESLAGRARQVDYKTIRYPGHRHLMNFLLSDLRLRERRDLLREILEASIPITFQDVVITFCSVTGHRRGQFVELSDVRKVYSRTIDGEPWSAVQITTAASLCTVLDLHRQGLLPGQGFVRQEAIELDDFLANRFAGCYRIRASDEPHQQEIF